MNPLAFLRTHWLSVEWSTGSYCAHWPDITRHAGCASQDPHLTPIPYRVLLASRWSEKDCRVGASQTYLLIEQDQLRPVSPGTRIRSDLWMSNKA